MQFATIKRAILNPLPSMSSGLFWELKTMFFDKKLFLNKEKHSKNIFLINCKDHIWAVFPSRPNNNINKPKIRN